MNSDCVDGINLDPPFDSDGDYQGPIGNKVAGAFVMDTCQRNEGDAVWLGEILGTLDGDGGVFVLGAVASFANCLRRTHLAKST